MGEWKVRPALSWQKATALNDVIIADDRGLTQCKAWPDKPIGVELVRQLLGTMTHEKVPIGTFITNGTFTKPAEELAKEDRLSAIRGWNNQSVLE